ncbi:hypothetical protein [Pediococcus claussenii]|uniref:Membrane protein n=1 Tax=Pediococcus claussenii (strain ATCC BAA-344 / DSM 14800 / JCM 18046 / KCTC 3811 / LMG 21948 / P06) TaxID=701521 RepID=G8PB95_PEDCP|nr:hypothetical protein [Pediococcus claussenii]AEV94724.1 putative membrane protein [Pediococcus claussenii ATCC BAA-344]ANZ69919.1 hypothetical protein AYR57_06165 [Pediococcus claussenii]ANZ71736.1 hypothetical protein AYR58_06170 [Pediococcus claussenii]
MKIWQVVALVVLGVITLGLATLTVELLFKGVFSDHLWVGIVGMITFGYATYSVYKAAKNKG